MEMGISLSDYICTIRVGFLVSFIVFSRKTPGPWPGVVHLSKGSSSIIKNVHLRELRVVDTNTAHGSFTDGLVDQSRGRLPSFVVIDSCSVQGKILGHGTVGGLVGGYGFSHPGVKIYNSYAALAVSQGSHQGSVAGIFDGTLSKSYGVGLVSGTGDNTRGLIRSCQHW